MIKLRILKMERLIWIISVTSKCHCKCPDQWEAEENYMHRKGEGSVDCRTRDLGHTATAKES